MIVVEILGGCVASISGDDLDEDGFRKNVDCVLVVDRDIEGRDQEDLSETEDGQQAVLSLFDIGEDASGVEHYRQQWQTLRERFQNQGAEGLSLRET